MIENLLKLTEEVKSSESLNNEQFLKWVGLFNEFNQYLNKPSGENKRFRDEFVNFTDNNNVFGNKGRELMKKTYEQIKPVYNLQIQGVLKAYVEKEKF
ncbi:hypothetical protein COS83_00120 [archaeon CG07_land_8_20_14_0_80_38_8]|nr:MAG: hypothetical protein COS83_00120 [archaeon CG07_land_8_20_14_0_80_38_8]PIU88746.1 MAG: hypothetical protein COS64_02575 [archaeon CG06_land_8_20_14_3_00_37_11]